MREGETKYQYEEENCLAAFGNFNSYVSSFISGGGDGGDQEKLKKQE